MEIRDRILIIWDTYIHTTLSSLSFLHCQILRHYYYATMLMLRVFFIFLMLFDAMLPCALLMPIIIFLLLLLPLFYYYAIRRRWLFFMLFLPPLFFSFSRIIFIIFTLWCAAIAAHQQHRWRHTPLWCQRAKVRHFSLFHFHCFSSKRTKEDVWLYIENSIVLEITKRYTDI